MSSRITLLLIEIVACALLILIFFESSTGFSPVVGWFCLALVYVHAAPFLLRARDITGIKTFMNTPLLFTVFYWVVFFLPYQLALLGSFDLRRSSFVSFTFYSASNQAIVLSTAGFVGFCAGYTFISSGRSFAGRDAIGRFGLEGGWTAYRGVSGPILVVLSLLVGSYITLGLRSSGEGRYSDSASGGVAADGVSLLILTLCVTSIGLTFAAKVESARVPFSLVLADLLSTSWAIRTLLLGDRNSFLLVALAALGGYFTFVRGASRPLMIAFIVVAYILYNAIESFRGSANTSVELLFSNIGSFKALDSGKDSSFDISTISVRAGISAVPSEYPFGNGIYKLIGFAGIVPLIRGFAVPSSLQFKASSDVLTQVVVGANPDWNVGSNIVSDIYLDWGAISVPLVLAVLGSVAAVAERTLRENSKSTAAMILYLLVLGQFAELPRYSVDFPVRMFAWTVVLLLLWRNVVVGGVGWRARARPREKASAR